MKKYLILLVLASIFSACSNDDNRMRNPYLPDYNFSANINMELPKYTDLLYTGNAVYVDQLGVGINDVIILNTGSGYAAWEASCPNQELSSCSRLDKEGIMAICPCDEAEYSLFTGQAEGKRYPLKSYRVEVINQTMIRVYN
ncbi:hypothetical protein [Flavobacterium sp. MK4S-17]|uniref:Rieske (2Fe-2S) protein n=1 Tax=Flavobacterium sp. MK4S-17 TaxID=2543737 RepID=UPI00135A9540|nr:hypothetical protein [Flavobacterium sp. MK4S-17]